MRGTSQALMRAFAVLIALLATASTVAASPWTASATQSVAANQAGTLTIALHAPAGATKEDSYLAGDVITFAPNSAIVSGLIPVSCTGASWIQTPDGFKFTLTKDAKSKLTLACDNVIFANNNGNALVQHTRNGVVQLLDSNGISFASAGSSAVHWASATLQPTDALPGQLADVVFDVQFDTEFTLTSANAMRFVVGSGYTYAAGATSCTGVASTGGNDRANVANAVPAAEAVTIDSFGNLVVAFAPKSPAAASVFRVQCAGIRAPAQPTTAHEHGIVSVAGVGASSSMNVAATGVAYASTLLGAASLSPNTYGASNAVLTLAGPDAALPAGIQLRIALNGFERAPPKAPVCHFGTVATTAEYSEDAGALLVSPVAPASLQTLSCSGFTVPTTPDVLILSADKPGFAGQYSAPVVAAVESSVRASLIVDQDEKTLVVTLPRPAFDLRSARAAFLLNANADDGFFELYSAVCLYQGRQLVVNAASATFSFAFPETVRKARAADDAVVITCTGVVIDAFEVPAGSNMFSFALYDESANTPPYAPVYFNGLRKTVFEQGSLELIAPFFDASSTLLLRIPSFAAPVPARAVLELILPVGYGPLVATSNANMCKVYADDGAPAGSSIYSYAVNATSSRFTFELYDTPAGTNYLIACTSQRVVAESTPAAPAGKPWLASYSLFMPPTSSTKQNRVYATGVVTLPTIQPLPSGGSINIVRTSTTAAPYISASDPGNSVRVTTDVVIPKGATLTVTYMGDDVGPRNGVSVSSAINLRYFKLSSYLHPSASGSFDFTSASAAATSSRNWTYTINSDPVPAGSYDGMMMWFLPQYHHPEDFKYALQLSYGKQILARGTLTYIGVRISPSSNWATSLVTPPGETNCVAGMVCDIRFVIDYFRVLPTSGPYTIRARMVTDGSVLIADRDQFLNNATYASAYSSSSSFVHGNAIGYNETSGEIELTVPADALPPLADNSSPYRSGFHFTLRGLRFMTVSTSGFFDQAGVYNADGSLLTRDPNTVTHSLSNFLAINKLYPAGSTGTVAAGDARPPLALTNAIKGARGSVSLNGAGLTPRYVTKFGPEHTLYFSIPNNNTVNFGVSSITPIYLNGQRLSNIGSDSTPESNRIRARVPDGVVVDISQDFIVTIDVDFISTGFTGRVIVDITANNPNSSTAGNWLLTVWSRSMVPADFVDPPYPKVVVSANADANTMDFALSDIPAGLSDSASFAINLAEFDYEPDQFPFVQNPGESAQPIRCTLPNGTEVATLTFANVVQKVAYVEPSVTLTMTFALARTWDTVLISCPNVRLPTNKFHQQYTKGTYKATSATAGLAKESSDRFYSLAAVNIVEFGQKIASIVPANTTAGSAPGVITITAAPLTAAIPAGAFFEYSLPLAWSFPQKLECRASTTARSFARANIALTATHSTYTSQADFASAVSWGAVPANSDERWVRVAFPTEVPAGAALRVFCDKVQVGADTSDAVADASLRIFDSKLRPIMQSSHAFIPAITDFVAPAAVVTSAFTIARAGAFSQGELDDLIEAVAESYDVPASRVSVVSQVARTAVSGSSVTVTFAVAGTAEHPVDAVLEAAPANNAAAVKSLTAATSAPVLSAANAAVLEVSSTCSNGVKDGTETAVDCGGSGCPARCTLGLACTTGSDCLSGICAGSKCVASTSAAAAPAAVAGVVATVVAALALLF